jgi:MFS family permease
VKALLTRRDFRVLIAGQTVSMFGDWMMFFALAIWAKQLTGSSSAAGLVFFVLALASLAAPLGGLLVDRVAKRPLMISTQLTLAAVMCLLLFVHDRGDIWILFVVTGLYGLFGDVFAAARSAMLKAMLPEELLAEANGAYQSIREGLRLFAPLAGAAVFAAFGGAVVALVNASTFVVAALALVRLPFVEPERAPHEQHFLHEVSAGITHIARTRVLRQLTIGLGAALFIAGFSETLMFAVTSDGLHRGPSFIGVIASFQGIGAIAGGVSAPVLMRRLGDLRLTGLGVALFGAGVVIWVVSNAAAVLAGTAVAGVGIAWAVVALGTSYQRRSPSHMQGRVAAAASMLFSVPQTISIAVGAALVLVLDYRVELAIMAVVFFAAAAYLLTRPAEETAEEVEPALAA